MKRDLPIRILFLCTGNACRSQMAESWARHLGGERIVACSAGSNPAGYIHPLAQNAAEQVGLTLDGHESKSWHEFATTRVDIVLTLCDHAAGQPCPTWLGSPVRVHWGLPDPVGLLGSEPQRRAFAVRVARALETSIRGMLELELESLPADELHGRLAELAPVVPD